MKHKRRAHKHKHMQDTQEYTYKSACDTHKTKAHKHMRHTREKTHKHTQAQAQVHKHMSQTKDKHTST